MRKTANRKKILSLLLSLSMMVAIIPSLALSVYATENYVCKIEETGYTTVQTAIDQAGTTATTIMMIADSQENVTIAYNQDITLDLNGHVLQGKSSDNSVITNNGTLTIKDSNTVGKTHKFTPNSDGLWVLDETSGKKTVAGGCITGGSKLSDTESRGGGVHNNGTFNIYGGSIIGNVADDGGGVYNLETFNMYGGNIVGNTACNGGGVYNAGACNFSGGKIFSNTATEQGGGVYYAACFVEGTKITMADGSEKNIEDVSEGESVKSFNHETGKYESNKVLLAYKGENEANYFTLEFASGTELSICGSHDLFEKAANKYVTISEDNLTDYIGKYFYNASAGTWDKLQSATKSTDAKNYYSLYVAKTFNCIANGMLSIPHDDYRLDIYTFNDDLTANQAALQADIDKYGICEFEDCKIVSTREEYEAQGVKYYKILLGKGIVTEEEIEAAYNEWYADKDPETSAESSSQKDTPSTPEASLLNDAGDNHTASLTEKTTASITIGGSTQITGNTLSDGTTANNLYMVDGKCVTIGTKTGDTEGNGVPALTEDASIGVTTEKAPTADLSVAITTNGDSDDKAFFTSDNNAYYVKFNTDFLELAVASIKIADDIEHGTVKISNQGASAGETVTVTATPDAGYELDKLTVTDVSGNDITAEVLNGMEITMPTEDKLPITVSASFKVKTAVTPTDKDSATGTTTKSKSTTSTTDTGDTNNLMLYFGLFDLVLLAVAVMLYRRLRKNK